MRDSAGISIIVFLIYGVPIIVFVWLIRRFLCLCNDVAEIKKVVGRTPGRGGDFSER